MKALVMLLLGYTAYRMAIRIREENSSRLLLTDHLAGFRFSPAQAALTHRTKDFLRLCGFAQ